MTSPSSRVLLILFLVYVALRAIAWQNTTLLEDHDSVGYLGDAAAVRSLDPAAIAAVSPDSTPVLPIAIAMFSLPGWSLVTAARLFTLLSSVLLFCVLWKLGRPALGPTATAAGLVLVAFNPVLIGMSVSVLSEPSYIATLYLGLWLFWRQAARPDLRSAALIGGVFALAFLNRTEGLLYVGLLPMLQALRLPWQGLSRVHLTRWLGWSAVYVAVFGALVLPQILSVSRKLGQPAINGRQVWMAVMNNPDGKSSNQKVYGLDFDPGQVNIEYLQSHAAALDSFSSDSGPGDVLRIVVGNVKDLVGRELGGLVGWAAVLLAVVGSVGLLRRGLVFETAVLGVFIAAALVGPLLYNVATRHIASIAPALLLLAGRGMADLVERVKDGSPARVAIVLVAAGACLAPFAGDLRQTVLDPPTANREYSPETLARPLEQVRRVSAELGRPLRICARKGYLALFSGSSRLALPNTDYDGLVRYLELNSPDLLFLEYGLLARFPFLETFEAGGAGSRFEPLYRGAGPTGEPLELYRFRQDDAPRRVFE